MKQILNQLYEEWIKPIAHDATIFASDVLFPIHCLGCNTYGSFLCETCKKELTKIKDQHCIVCHKNSLMGITHPGCMSPQKPDGLISLYDYHDKKISHSIIQGKYYFIRSIYELLGQLAVQRIEQDFHFLLHQQFLISPIPLAKSRERWRGFNQAEVIAQAISNTLPIPIAHTLIRNRQTKTQKDLKKEQRVKNVSDAFLINPQTEIKGKHILLIDDVVTTGSTLMEAVKTLKRNGASKVWCLTLARD